MLHFAGVTPACVKRLGRRAAHGGRRAARAGTMVPKSLRIQPAWPLTPSGSGGAIGDWHQVVTLGLARV